MPPAGDPITLVAMTDQPPFAATWRAAFADASGAAFRRLVAPDVRLEASVLPAPVAGADPVFAVLSRAGGLYDALRFTRETAGDRRVCLEWEARALGLALGGVTVLSLAPDGRVAHVALHHRPLDAVVAVARALSVTAAGPAPRRGSRR
jgi:hypothetical protein